MRRSILLLGSCAATLAGLIAGCLGNGAPIPLPRSSPDDAGEAEVEPVDAGPYPDVQTPRWLSDARVFVNGVAIGNRALDCRKVICRHNENTDMTTYEGAIWLVHRTAESQVLGPDSALHVYESVDRGKTFVETARIEAPTTRDIRDPAFYHVGNALYMKALTRLPVVSTRDSNVDTITVGFSTTDGTTWKPLGAIGPPGWSFWRIKEHAGVFYSAAYQDGDRQVVLYTSKDGVSWTAGPPIYTISADTPLETELTFMPGGKLLALVRMDGDDMELLGDVGPLRTKICWASPPYSSFECPQQFDDARLDGPVSFFSGSRLFVVARKHLQMGTDLKRTDLYELTGDFDGGPLQIRDWGELPSAGDTSYAGIAPTDATQEHFAVSWYSSDLTTDPPWIIGMLGPTDIWLGEIDISRLH
jgi:hypothetical protein